MNVKPGSTAMPARARSFAYIVAFSTTLLMFSPSDAFSSNQSGNQPAFVCGVRFSESGRHDAFVKSMVSNFFSRIAEKKKVDVDVRWYTDDASLFRDLQAGELNFFYYHKRITSGIVENVEFRPWIRYEFIGSNKDRACVYVKKNSDIKKLSRLDGKKFATQPELNEYALLRIVLNKKPQDVFSETILNRDAEESLGLLIKGEADAAFVFKSNVSFMKIANNHLINDIRELSCSTPLEFPPVYLVDGTPPEISEAIRKLAVFAHESDDMADFRPLFKTYGFRFVAASESDFPNIDKFLAESEKNGWNADFEEWLASVERHK